MFYHFADHAREDDGIAPGGWVHVGALEHEHDGGQDGLVELAKHPLPTPVALVGAHPDLAHVLQHVLVQQRLLLQVRRVL
jgi:hypothetical protein